jgi:hypothetical protein
MKKIFLTLAIVGIVSVADAQTTSGQGAGNTTQSSSAAKTKNAKNKKNNTTTPDTVNNRKIYKSKATGQTATPTGQQATGTNGSHSNMPKNAGKNED